MCGRSSYFIFPYLCFFVPRCVVHWNTSHISLSKNHLCWSASCNINAFVIPLLGNYNKIHIDYQHTIIFKIGIAFFRIFSLVTAILALLVLNILLDQERIQYFFNYVNLIWRMRKLSANAMAFLNHCRTVKLNLCN